MSDPVSKQPSPLSRAEHTFEAQREIRSWKVKAERVQRENRLWRDQGVWVSRRHIAYDKYELYVSRPPMGFFISGTHEEIAEVANRMLDALERPRRRKGAALGEEIARE